MAISYTVTFNGTSIDYGVAYPAAYSLPKASASVLGGIKVGSNLTIDGNGVLSAEDGNYILPTAAVNTLGGIKIGTGLSIDGDGVASVSVDTSTLMVKSANLSDVADAATSRSNLGLGGAAVLDTSLGGNAASDSGKVAIFSATGGLVGSASADIGVQGITSEGTGVVGTSIDTGTAISGTSTNGTGLAATSSAGTYHATFGETGDNRSFIERVKGVFGWFRGAYTGKIKAADTLTADRVWTFPNVPSGNVVIDTATQTLTNKTFTAPVLGTPASGNLANCTVGATHGVAKAILTKTSNFTAELGGRYITESGGTISVTDPAGTTAGDSYEVWIGSGSIQFNGTGTTYSASRFSIRRRYNGSAWTTPSPTLTDTLTVGSGTWNGSTISGAQTISGQLECTGQSATNGTSVITRDLGDARYHSFSNYFPFVIAGLSLNSGNGGSAAYGNKRGTLEFYTGTSASSYAIVSAMTSWVCGFTPTTTNKFAIVVGSSSAYYAPKTNNDIYIQYGRQYSTTPGIIAEKGFGVRIEANGNVRAYVHNGTALTYGSTGAFPAKRYMMMVEYVPSTGVYVYTLDLTGTRTLVSSVTTGLPSGGFTNEASGIATEAIIVNNGTPASGLDVHYLSQFGILASY